MFISKEPTRTVTSRKSDISLESYAAFSYNEETKKTFDGKWTTPEEPKLETKTRILKHFDAKLSQKSKNKISAFDSIMAKIEVMETNTSQRAEIVLNNFFSSETVSIAEPSGFLHISY